MVTSNIQTKSSIIFERIEEVEEQPMDSGVEMKELIGCNNQNQSSSTMTPVQQMFNGRSVFITGASGFIGRVLLAKLLSAYPGIKNIYILLRPKRNMSPEERLSKQMLQLPIFELIRKQHADPDALFAKIRIVSGDIGEPWLGLSGDDLDMLLSDPTLSIVFHSAATVKFDAPLRSSVKMNLLATKTIIDLCKRLPNLISLCHVSSAYVNSDISDHAMIEERLYEMRDQPETLIQMADLMDETMMQLLKSRLVDKRPNTYTYTKALAEHLIAKEASELPVVIVRPSIVVAGWREPIPGWIDNYNGPSGLLLAINKGLLRTMHVNTSGKSDLIPVDITVNAMIASAYYAAKKHNKLTNMAMLNQSSAIQGNTNDENVHDEQHQLERPYVVHCNSGQLNPITWGTIEKQVFPIIRDHPSEQVMRYPFGTFKSNYYHDFVTRLFVHLLPALILDLIMRKRFFVPIYAKLHGAVGALTHFCITNYEFQTKNLAIIHNELSPEDRDILKVDIENMNWLAFWKNYIIGIRRFILKEKDETLPEARHNLQRALWIERGLRLILCFFALSFFLRVFIPTMKSIWIR